jgi:hypothetical protein
MLIKICYFDEFGGLRYMDKGESSDKHVATVRFEKIPPRPLSQALRGSFGMTSSFIYLIKKNVFSSLRWKGRRERADEKSFRVSKVIRHSTFLRRA